MRMPMFSCHNDVIIVLMNGTSFLGKVEWYDMWMQNQESFVLTASYRCLPSIETFIEDLFKIWKYLHLYMQKLEIHCITVCHERVSCFLQQCINMPSGAATLGARGHVPPPPPVFILASVMSLVFGRIYIYVGHPEWLTYGETRNIRLNTFVSLYTLAL